ncbi:MAG: glycosyltransferase family 2 protein [Elusimicrobia bacterium]|nr:glycosyltransferase family 2 protein [Elusimicrobiota bacterium]
MVSITLQVIGFTAISTVCARCSFILFLIFIAFSLSNQIFIAPRNSSSYNKWLEFNPVENLNICVVMTAYNDEESIGISVKDFKTREFVGEVIAIDNNSTDKTSAIAEQAGARVYRESIQGYGACCMRALKEGLKSNCNVVCLVEGDGTFSGSDLKKLVAYLENADMVIGTRTTIELNTPDSQMNLFMQYGNVFMAKLLQLRFWKVRLTDLGCTYRIIRKDSLARIIERLTITGNEFLCEMTLAALEENLKVIEVPLSLKKRIGKSKGVGGNIYKGFMTGMRMWRLILFN